MDQRATPTKIEVREEGDARILAGYAAVFNSPSEPLWGDLREVVRPGAFTRSIGERDVFALADHDSGKRLARTKNGTLRLAEDKRGLRVEIDLPDTQLGNDIHNEVRAGLLDAMSFGFSVVNENFSEEDEGSLRELVDVNLFEVSVVSFPAYKATTLEAREHYQAWVEENKIIRPQRLSRVRMKRSLAGLPLV